MMDAREFGDWFAGLCRHFSALDVEADAADFRKFMGDLNATRDEADAAFWTIKTDGVSFRTKIMPALRAAVLARRAEANPKGQAVDCHVCGGTGMVSVPHPERIKDGIWDGKTTCAVGCSCGNRYPPGLRSLSNYETEFPNWPILMNRTDDERIVRAGLDPALMREELGFLMGEIHAGRMTPKEARARYTEPFVEARKERERQAAAAKLKEDRAALASMATKTNDRPEAFWTPPVAQEA